MIILSIRYKVDIIQQLKEAGYNTTRIRKEKIFGEAMLQKIREGEMVSWKIFDLLCQLLNCQPGDIIEYVPDGQEQS